MLDWLNTFLTSHHELIGLVIFLIVLFDCLALVGLAVPGNTLLVIASIIAGSYNYPLWKAFILAVLGGWFGDIISYGIGYKLKNKIYNLKIIKNNPKWIITADDYLKRYGLMGLLLGRFVSPLRATMPMMVGIFHFPVIKFLLITFIASSIWTACFVIPSWITGAAILLPVGKLFWIELSCVLIILSVLLIIGIYGCLKQKRRITAFISVASFVLLALLYFCLPYLQALDQGLLSVSHKVYSVSLEHLAKFVTELGGYKVQFVISAVLCFLLLFMKQIRPLIFFAFTMMGTAVLGWIIKEMICRVRPLAMTDTMQTYSFPSGHASASFAFFMCIGVLAGLGRPPKIRVFWLFITSLPAVLISLSRVYLSVHWVTDIIAGGLLAMGVCTFTLTWVELRKEMLPLPAKCWKTLLPIALMVLLCGAAVLSLKAT